MAKLLAVVEVAESARVQCQEPGCGHSVYKRIHVVEDNGQLLVLGSTCFAKRYDGSDSLGETRFGGLEGRRLTDVERQLLVENTQGLLAQFQREHEVEVERQRARLQEMRDQLQAIRPTVVRKFQPGERKAIPGMPWHWVKPMSSMAYFHLQDGSGWIRVMQKNHTHVIMPWPSFDGWDESLPPSVGTPELQLGGYVVNDVVATVGYLRGKSAWERIGVWSEIMDAITKKLAS